MSDPFTFDYEAFRERLAADPLGLGYPPDIDDWPPKKQSEYLVAASAARDALLAESDGLVGAASLAGPYDEIGLDWEDESRPTGHNGEFLR